MSLSACRRERSNLPIQRSAMSWIDRIEVMQFLAPAPHRRDKVGFFQNHQMLAHRLPRHREPCAEFVQRLAVLRAQPVEQIPAAAVGERLENSIRRSIHDHNMQPFGCLSRLQRQAYHAKSLEALSPLVDLTSWISRLRGMTEESLFRRVDDRVVARGVEVEQIRELYIMRR